MMLATDLAKLMSLMFSYQASKQARSVMRQASKVWHVLGNIYSVG